MSNSSRVNGRSAVPVGYRDVDYRRVYRSLHLQMCRSETGNSNVSHHFRIERHDNGRTSAAQRINTFSTFKRQKHSNLKHTV